MPIARKSHHHQCRRPRCPVTANFLNRGGAIADSGRGRGKLGRWRKCLAFLFSFLGKLCPATSLSIILLGHHQHHFLVLPVVEVEGEGGVPFPRLIEPETWQITTRAHKVCSLMLYDILVCVRNGWSSGVFHSLFNPMRLSQEGEGERSRCQKRWTNIKKWAFSLHLSGW